MFYAHSHPTAACEPLDDHLRDVSELARGFASKFGAGDWGEIVGALHDLGKATPAFQARLRGAPQRVDHATAGARLAAELFNRDGLLLAQVIAGHHAGLADGDGDGQPTALKRRLDPKAYPIPTVTPWESRVPLPSTLSHFAPLLRFDAKSLPDREGFSRAFRARMLFSALIDADRLATEAFYRRADGKAAAERAMWSPLIELKAALDAHMGRTVEAARTASRSAGQAKLNSHRSAILDAARRAAGQAPGLFSLTVPTGGGKTLASLTFALDHAVAHGLDRVIYVIPFTSIIEQTAQVLRTVLAPAGLDDHIIEHHSAFRDDEALATKSNGDESALQAGERLAFAIENWDAPIIVTTAVQFFESLFSNRPSRCRKLHNIARSAIIFDEAQTLPQSLLRPTLAAIEELCHGYSASAVLCTATQPAIMTERRDGKPGLFGGLREVREIVDDPDALFTALARVTVRPAITRYAPPDLVSVLAAEPKVLCIVGTRAQARDLSRDLANATSFETTFHLSALMCPSHRSRQLVRIRDALAAGTARVIATTVVEAGVDIDFPRVFRQKAGLDSIAQAAGRCNREGNRPKEEAIVEVFEVDGWSVIPALNSTLDAANTAFRRVAERGIDPLGPEAIEVYFRELFWTPSGASARGTDKLDRKAIMQTLAEKPEAPPLATVAGLYRVIESDMEPIIIPYDDEARAALRVLADPSLPSDGIRDTARRLQPYLVNVPSRIAAALAPRLEPINPHRFERQFLRLSDEGHQALYSETVGLDWSDPTFRSVESLLL